jgi:DNA-binding XRE family transcriptional regulator
MSSPEPRTGHICILFAGPLSRILEWKLNSGARIANLAGVPESSSPRKSIFSPGYDAFLQLLREARQKAGLTQREAAQKMNRSQSYVAQSETGERRVDVVELMEFLRAYGVRPEQFIKKL